jgi:hypothetical protein
MNNVCILTIINYKFICDINAKLNKCGDCRKQQAS